MNSDVGVQDMMTLISQCKPLLYLHDALRTSSVSLRTYHCTCGLYFVSCPSCIEQRRTHHKDIYIVYDNKVLETSQARIHSHRLEAYHATELDVVADMAKAA